MAVLSVGHAADQSRFPSRNFRSRQASALTRLGHDLFADAVARQDRNLHSLSPQSIEFEVVQTTVCDSHGFFSRRLGFIGADLVGMAQRQRDVVEAVDQAVLAERLRGRRRVSAPSGLTITWRSDVDQQFDNRRKAFTSSNSWRTWRSGSTIGSRPLLKLLLKKMSAKLGAIITLESRTGRIAHGACSRDEPQPKLLARDQHRRALDSAAGSARSRG
jgi:hypothetical protein